MSARAQDLLLDGLPPPPRLLAECLLVVTVVFVAPPAVSAALAFWRWYALAGALVVCGAWALALTHRRPLSALAAAMGVAAALWSTTVHAPTAPPRLGVRTADMPGCAGVTNVIPGRPADGTLRLGDCITALAGQPLDPRAPSADLIARLRDGTKVPAGPTAITLTRGGARQDAQVRLGAPAAGPQLAGSDLPWLLLRSFGILAIIAALLAADGQSARQIGLDPRILGRELLWGAPVLAGAFATHIAVGVPVALVMNLLKMTGSETTQRIGALLGIVNDVSFWQIVPTLVVLALFEEVLFRGFLLPRARRLTGRWWMAIAAVQLLFGLGHIYEGAFAVAQTMMLGVYFSVAFLWRRHLGSVIVAHTAFNTLMFALVFFLQRSGVLEKLQSLR